MNRPYDIEIPYRLNQRTTLRLKVHDNRLLGSANHRIRVDLYPLLSPSFKGRHYGWWEIPLHMMQRPRAELLFDIEHKTIRCDQSIGSLHIESGWNGGFDEPGHCVLHNSLWEGLGHGERVTESWSSHHLILRPEEDLPPKQLFIPVTERCNLRCTMCPRQATDELTERDISDEVLGPLLEVCPDVVSVFLQGYGEPLLYGNLFGLIRAVKSRVRQGAEVGFTTNATLLNDANVADLFETDLDFLYFSVDGASRETYEATRQGAQFDKVLANIRRCVRRRTERRGAGPRFMMNLVITERNMHEIPRYVELAAFIGVEHVTLSACHDNPDHELKRYKREAMEALLRQAAYLAEKHGIQVDLPVICGPGEERCLMMERLVVMVDGEVLPCQSLARRYVRGIRPARFGNVCTASVREIWNGPQFREFRRRVLAEEFAPECSGCGEKSYLVK